MSTVTAATLQAQAEQIRQETTLRANTARRVGQMLVDLVDSGAMGSVYNITPGATAADSQAAIQAAIDAANTAGGGTVYLQRGTHLLSTRVTLKSKVTLKGAIGAVLKLADGANEFCVAIANGATDVRISGFEIDGNKANNPTGQAGIQSGDATGSRISVDGMYIHDCAGDGIRLSGSVVKVSGCSSISNGLAGITGSSISYFGFVNNYAASNGTHNIGLIGTGTYGVIDGNTAELSGALADNLTGYSAANQFVAWTNNVTRAGGNNGAHVGGLNITFSNNTIEDATDYGLIARNSDVSAMVGFVCVGNVIANSGTSGANSGVWLGNLSDFVFSNNTVRGSWAHGVLIQEACVDGVVCGNVVNDNGTGAGSGNGLRIVGASSRISVNGNLAKDNVSEGFQITDSTRLAITGNIARGNSVPIAIDGTSTDNYVNGNDFTGNTSDGPLLSASGVKYWANSPNGGSFNLAASASMILPVYTDYFRVTGSSGISAIAASWPQRRVTLRFAATPVVTSGAGLVIGSGVFTGIANAALSLISDGGTWFETGRSPIG